ncbi:hypothetical protein BU17DRAFT_70121 [Hysterangium stoloniferum]|nr:hypothetical protein BU17DRAFT_70121 [Hysterangium stoloniferum]
MPTWVQAPRGGQSDSRFLEKVRQYDLLRLIIVLLRITSMLVTTSPFLQEIVTLVPGDSDADSPLKDAPLHPHPYHVLALLLAAAAANFLSSLSFLELPLRTVKGMANDGGLLERKWLKSDKREEATPLDQNKQMRPFCETVNRGDGDALFKLIRVGTPVQALHTCQHRGSGANTQWEQNDGSYPKPLAPLDPSTNCLQALDMCADAEQLSSELSRGL